MEPTAVLSQGSVRRQRVERTVSNFLSLTVTNYHTVGGCCNELPKTWWLKMTQMCPLIVLQAKSLTWVSLGSN